MNGHVSPRLGVRFELGVNGLRIIRPDGSPFLTFEELGRLAEQERHRGEHERRRAEQERQRADDAAREAESLRQRLRELGHGDA